jgi:hypothetical protein
MPQSRLLGLLGLLCVVKGGIVAIKNKKDHRTLDVIRAHNNLIKIDTRGLKVV